MLIYVDIDNTICQTEGARYADAKPLFHNIEKINNLHKDNTIVYWTARGSKTKIDWFDLTEFQLNAWGCKYDNLIVGEKPPYDLLICDKTKKIEEL